MKKILWIDDSPKELYRLVDNVIKPLWENEIVSQIFIVGDYYKISSNINENQRSKQVEDLNNKIFDKYVDYIIEKGINNDKALDNLYLVNSDNMRENTKTSNMAEINNELLSEELINRWKRYSEELINEGESNKETDQPDAYERIIEENKEDSQIVIDYLKNKGFNAILIDMRLIEGDSDKLSAPLDESYKYKYMIPILSMFLYYCLKDEPNINVFMFTSLTAPNEYIKNWKKCYKHVFRDDSKVVFYNKKGEQVDNKSDNIVNNLKRFVNKDNTEEKNND